MFFADLHVHSRFSRATSRDTGLAHLALWARLKGLAVVATGDFTHPKWRAELLEQLEPDVPGLFRLRSAIQSRVDADVPPICRERLPGPTQFILQAEIATIYKKDGATRRIHHLILAPGFEEAEAIARRLSAIGNLASDGRPILGLDSRDLMEIVLEAGPGCCLIPAHIWTPWFSVLGSKSGFDSVEACYGDLAGHVFAAETGLSADPSMCRRVGSLDRVRLVSNSDAHSPPKLGREACVFECPADYPAILRALQTGKGYGGTVEFFPEEGKYHLDGHRACGVRLEPKETRRLKGLCPSCGKPVTVGVMSRVEDLATRPEDSRLLGAAPFRSFIPLPEILAELLGTSPASRKVDAAWRRLISSLGPELFILDSATAANLDREGPPRLGEAIERMRRGQVVREAGFDGEFGVVRVFGAEK